MTNADQLQEGLEHSAFEDELVVSADGVGFAVLPDGQTQVADQRPVALVDHRRQSGADARAVIDDAQNRAWCATAVCTKVRSTSQTPLTPTGAGRLLRSSREMLSGAYRWLRMVSLTKDLPTLIGACKRLKVSATLRQPTCLPIRALRRRTSCITQSDCLRVSGAGMSTAVVSGAGAQVRQHQHAVAKLKKSMVR